MLRHAPSLPALPLETGTMEPLRNGHRDGPVTTTFYGSQGSNIFSQFYVDSFMKIDQV